jgi:pimeloyl-ACP methyl ester carboxylesterase
MRDRIARQRARLETAERDTFAHFGVAVTSSPLILPGLGLTTRVIRSGQGPPAVLLHGGSMTATVFAPLLPHLPGRSLFLVDLPGCGFADSFDYTAVDIPAHQAAFVVEVLDALELDRAAVIGTSLGGMFALRAALDAPERVTAAALMSAPAVLLPGATVPIIMAVAGTALGRWLSMVAPPPSARMTRRLLSTLGGDGPPASVPEVFYDALGAATAIAARSNATLTPRLFRWRTPHPEAQVTDAKLATCEVPVAMIWGDDDRVQGPDAGRHAAEVLPDARLDVLPGGHGIWVDQPERCGRLLAEFLERIEQRQA